MSYIPHTDEERRAMLEAIGLPDLAALFTDVPEAYRFPGLSLPPAASELEVMRSLQEMAALNLDVTRTPTFLGAGAYRHWIPATVDFVISRSEFYTAYTPYQPEVSQGTLQTIFEYQSMICDLTGMEVANASHYDGATAVAEAAIQALNVFRYKRTKIVVAPTVNPQYRQVLRTYLQGQAVEIVGDEVLCCPTDLLLQADENTACFIVQSPNFLGQIEDLKALKETLVERTRDARGKSALLVVVTNPLSLGLLKPPADYGADIVLGEAQPLGIPLALGGPYLGFYASKMEYVRQMAGRIIGETVDVEGKRGYVMTLTPREQHISRARASSNICSNQGLMALAATVYLATLGRQGLRRVAELNYHKAHHAASLIEQIEGYQVDRSKPFFNEFVVTCPAPVADINEYLLHEWGILGGYDLSQDYPELGNAMLVAVTEMNTAEEIELLARALRDYDPNWDAEWHEGDVEEEQA